MLNITQDQAERIAYSWIRQQESSLDCYGGYPGNLYVVRDMLVSFINCNGEKYDGPSVDIMTVDEAIEKANDYIDNYDDSDDYEDDDDCEDVDENKEDWRQHEAFFGESVQSLAKYLMTAKGGPDNYNPGCPYKEDAPALKRFLEKCES